LRNNKSYGHFKVQIEFVEMIRNLQQLVCLYFRIKWVNIIKYLHFATVFFVLYTVKIILPRLENVSLNTQQ